MKQMRDVCTTRGVAIEATFVAKTRGGEEGDQVTRKVRLSKKDRVRVRCQESGCAKNAIWSERRYFIGPTGLSIAFRYSCNSHVERTYA